MAVEPCVSPVEPPAVAPPPAPPAGPAAAVELRILVQQAQAGDARPSRGSAPSSMTGPRSGSTSAICPPWWSAPGSARWPPNHPLAVESMKRTVEAMKVELAGAHPTRLEAMLVDQVVACWMEAKSVEHRSASAGTSSLDQAGFRLKRLESAQKQFQNAVQALTRTRALLPAGLAPAQAVKLHDPKRQVG
jgi:hypothetical protein